MGHSKAFCAAAWLLGAAGAAACGGGSATAPTVTTTTPPAVPSVPISIVAASQRVNLLNNEIQVNWLSNGSSYLVTVGTTAGASDVLSTEITAPPYTWITPRQAGTYYFRAVTKLNGQVSGPSTDLPLSVIDLRHVIDAMYFHAGPMSDSPTNALGNPPANVWPDGTALRVLVSSEAGESVRSAAQIFLDQYAALLGNAVTATTEITPDNMHATSFPSGVAVNTIGVRVLAGSCGSGTAVACAYYGPAPLGPNRSLVSLVALGLQNIQAVAHEMGHAYGMGHVLRPAGNAQLDLTFMMHTSVSLSQSQMSAVEKSAILLARSAGLSNGWTRNQALAAGLVLPYAPASFSTSGFRGVPSERRDSTGWILVDSVKK